MKTEFPDPEKNLLEFLSFLISYSESRNLRGIESKLKALPTSFGIPPTDDFGLILNGLNQLPKDEVLKLPIEIKLAIERLKMSLKRMFGGK